MKLSFNLSGWNFVLLSFPYSMRKRNYSYSVPLKLAKINSTKEVGINPSTFAASAANLSQEGVKLDADLMICLWGTFLFFLFGYTAKGFKDLYLGIEPSVCVCM